MRYSNIREEELKNRVATDFFDDYDCDTIIQNIDFSVRLKYNTIVDSDYFLWAEAKNKPTDINLMLTQLILTIGKARTFDNIMPPPFLGCFDTEKITFIDYAEIKDIFYITDFNWNITPSLVNT